MGKICKNYQLYVSNQSLGKLKSSQKISSDEGGGPPLSAGDRFGFSVSSLGDLDGDGVADLAVGAADDTGGENCGAVYVLFMNMDGTVKSFQKMLHAAKPGDVVEDQPVELVPLVGRVESGRVMEDFPGA